MILNADFSHPLAFNLWKTPSQQCWKGDECVCLQQSLPQACHLESYCFVFCVWWACARDLLCSKEIKEIPIIFLAVFLCKQRRIAANVWCVGWSEVEPFCFRLLRGIYKRPRVHLSYLQPSRSGWFVVCMQHFFSLDGCQSVAFLPLALKMAFDMYL